MLEAHIQETTVPVQLEPVGAHVAGHGTSHHVAQPLGHAHGAHHGSVMPPHHDPHDALASDNPRHGMHDGTMYAQGNSAMRLAGLLTKRQSRDISCTSSRVGHSARAACIVVELAFFKNLASCCAASGGRQCGSTACLQCDWRFVLLRILFALQGLLASPTRKQHQHTMGKGPTCSMGCVSLSHI